MILLASTSDVLRLVTLDSGSVDVHASWADLNAGTITLGRTNTTVINTATTTSIAGSPGASTYRSVKTVTIRNTSALGGKRTSVSIRHYDGSNAVELVNAMLWPLWSLNYDENRGWFILDGDGSEVYVDSVIDTAPAVGALFDATLTADVVNSCATANMMYSIPDLAFWIDGTGSAKTYWFRWVLIYTAAATTTGGRFSLSGIVSSVTLRYRSEYSLSTTSVTTIEGSSAGDTPSASNATSAATGANIATIEGFITTTSGTEVTSIFPRFASEVLSSAITVKAGSNLTWMRTV
jgi:hypothetical protein